MPTPPAPCPEPVYGLAGRLVGMLTHTASELFLESGPYLPGVDAVEALARGTYHEINNQSLAARRVPHPAGVAALFAQLDIHLDGVHEKILPALTKARRAGGVPQQRKTLKQTAALCVAHRNRACRAFGVPLPVRQSARLQGDAIRAVVVTDLVGYTTRARKLAQSDGAVLGPQAELGAVQRLNQTIVDQLQNALYDTPRPGAGGRNWFDHHIQSTGDGAILCFDSVREAVGFAVRVHREADDYSSRSKLSPEWAYRHRVGIGFGNLHFRTEAVGDYRQLHVLGIPLIDSTRMEACSPVGGIAIHPLAWDRLSGEPAGADADVAGLLPAFRLASDIPVINGETYDARLWSPPDGPRP